MGLPAAAMPIIWVAFSGRQDLTATTVGTQADLSISKGAPATATAGDSAGFDYTLTVHNGGPSDNTGGFHATDTLPAGTSFQTGGSSTSCLASGQTVTCSNTSGLAAGADQAFTIHVKVASSVAEGTVLHYSGSVASDGTSDPDGTNNSSGTTSTTVHAQADVADLKTTDSTVVAGNQITFTIKATNGINPDVTQSFTLKVTRAPAITSVNSVKFLAGSAGSFTVRTSGFPLPSISETVRSTSS